MFLTILFAFLGLIGLIVLHEFGHFILAKKFGVKVEEFGIGLPPRLIGKKIGETIYSLNLLPFGAFVKLPGEIEKLDDPRSFSNQPVFKRMLIVLAGVISFWLMAAILFTVVFKLGTAVAINDEDQGFDNAKVQIIGVSANSPAQEVGLLPGDKILSVKLKNEKEAIKINKIKELQEFTEKNKGKEVVLLIEREKNIFEISLIPRTNPPANEGAMGVALLRITFKSYPWYLAPIEGIKATFNLTQGIVLGYIEVIKNLLAKKPTGVQLTGPVGIFQFLMQASQSGTAYFLQFLGMIAVYLAIFNILPIPALDGGKMLFLTIEAVRKKPVSQEIEQKITTAFFAFFIALFIWVTIKDIIRIF